SSALPAALGALLRGFLLGRLFLRSGLGFFLGGGFLLRRRLLGGLLFCRRLARRRRLRRGGSARALGDDQLLLSFFFDNLFGVAADLLFLKMHELVFVAWFFFAVGHLSSPFDPSLFRGVQWQLRPPRAYKRNPACLSSTSQSPRILRIRIAPNIRDKKEEKAS